MVQKFADIVGNCKTTMLSSECQNHVTIAEQNLQTLEKIGPKQITEILSTTASTVGIITKATQKKIV